MKKLHLAGCAILGEGGILLLHRTKTGWYELPGGKIDEGETPEETACRELQEELACEVEILRHLGDKDFEEDGYTMGYTWFLAKIKDGHEASVGEPEKFSHCKYISLDELAGQALSPNMANFLLELETGGIEL